jgi:hypothetical protein
LEIDGTKPRQRYLLKIGLCLAVLNAMSPQLPDKKREMELTSGMAPKEKMERFCRSSLHFGLVFSPEISVVVGTAGMNREQLVEKLVQSVSELARKNKCVPLEMFFEFQPAQELIVSFDGDVCFGEKPIMFWYHLVFGLNADLRAPMALFVRRRGYSADYFVWKTGSKVERNPAEMRCNVQFCYYEILEIKSKA